LVIDPVLVYETRLGQGLINGMAVDGAGNTWVARSVWPQTFFGPTEVLTKLDANGTAVFTTYLDAGLGGISGASVTAVTVDAAGSAYITGYAKKPDLPTVSAVQPAPGGNGDAFVGKLTPDGSRFVYLTYLGGSDNDGGISIAVDLAGNAYVTGFTCSVDFPTVNAAQKAFGGKGKSGCDAFAAKLNAKGSALIYSTYLGQSGRIRGGDRRGRRRRCLDCGGYQLNRLPHQKPAPGSAGALPPQQRPLVHRRFCRQTESQRRNRLFHIPGMGWI